MKLMNYYTPRGLVRNSDLAETFENMLSSFFGTDIESVSGKYWPRVDIEETKEAYLIKAELPGMSKKEVSVELDNNILTISGEKKEETEDRTFHRKEIFSGSFSRTFSLPEHVDTEHVTAEFKNGILSLTIPKAEKEHKKQITIK